MREIIFRGKRSNGEWVYGSLLRAVGFCCIYRVTGTFELEQSYIIPDSVGQYTGLRDSKRTAEHPEGQMIFEGDVVDDGRGNKLVVCYGKHTIYCCGCCYDSHQSCGFYLILPEYVNKEDGCEYVYADGECWEDLIVIGNIHDHPELLKGGEGDTKVY